MNDYIYIRDDFCMHKFPIIEHNGRFGAIGNGNRFQTIEEWFETGAAYSEEEAEKNHDEHWSLSKTAARRESIRIENILNKCLIEFSINSKESSFTVKNRGVYEAKRFAQFLRTAADEYEKKTEVVKRLAILISQLKLDGNKIEMIKTARAKYQAEYGEYVSPSTVKHVIDLYFNDTIVDDCDTW